MVSKYAEWLPGGHFENFQNSKMMCINPDWYLKNVCNIKKIHPWWHLDQNAGDRWTWVNTRFYHLEIRPVEMESKKLTMFLSNCIYYQRYFNASSLPSMASDKMHVSLLLPNIKVYKHHRSPAALIFSKDHNEVPIMHFAFKTQVLVQISQCSFLPISIIMPSHPFSLNLVHISQCSFLPISIVMPSHPFPLKVLVHQFLKTQIPSASYLWLLQDGFYRASINFIKILSTGEDINAPAFLA